MLYHSHAWRYSRVARACQHAGFLFGCVTILLAAGCNRANRPVSVEQAESYGELPGLQATHDEALQKEFAYVTAELGTPFQLDRLRTEGRSEDPFTDSRNAAAAMRQIFAGQDAERLNEHARRLLPETFVFDDIKLQRMREFLASHKHDQLRFRAALLREHCDFGLRLSDGFFANLDFVQEVEFGVLLETMVVADLLERDKPDRAIEALGFMFRLVGLLSQEKHIVPRITAVHLRHRVLRVVAAVARHGQASDATLEQLFELLMSQLSRWPDDADAWIGDRAIGLQSYEMIREGHLLSLVSDKEVERLKKMGVVDTLIENLDADELFYMRTMRQLIEVSNRPYYRRLTKLQELHESVEAARKTARFPVVAIEFLLPDYRSGQQLQAQDRARCEAWAVVLAARLGRERQPYTTNPLTGKPYEVRVGTDGVELKNVDPQDADSHIQIAREPLSVLR